MSKNSNHETRDDIKVFIDPMYLKPIKLFKISDLNKFDENDLINTRHVDNIIGNFNLLAFEPILVARLPDGSLHIMEGHHRVNVAETKGATHMYGYEIEASNQAELAKMYRIFSRSKKYKSSINLHKVAQVENIPENVRVQHSIERYNFKIGSKNKDNEIGYVGELLKADKKFGNYVVNVTLHCLRRVWNGSANSLTVEVFKSLALFINVAHGYRCFDIDQFCNRLEAINPDEITRMVRGATTLRPWQRVVLDTFAENYNKGRKQQRIPSHLEWKKSK